MRALSSRLILLAFCLLFLGFAERRYKSTDNISDDATSDVFPCDRWTIPGYQAARINNAPDIDGKLDDAAWQNATRSPAFKDLVHGTETHRDTRVAVLFDEQFLYIAYWIEEPNVTATLKDRDAPIYKNNDVELFIAGKDAYYELEINAYATIYEVLFFWKDAYQRDGYATMPQFDQKDPLAKPFNGVGYKTHPRGMRLGFWSWDFPGLRKDVSINGTLNDDRDLDKGWTVELALPWSGMDILAKGDGRSIPPKPGDVWRMDFSRFNTYKDTSPNTNDSGGWAWSPHGVWDSHVPECFTYVEF